MKSIIDLSPSNRIVRQEPPAHSGVTRAEPFKQKFEGSVRRRVPEDPALLSLPEHGSGGVSLSARRLAAFAKSARRGVIRPRTYNAQIRSTLTWRGQAPLRG